MSLRSLRGILRMDKGTQSSLRYSSATIHKLPDAVAIKVTLDQLLKEGGRKMSWLVSVHAT